MKNNVYITTTLPYVNADPHIGHTLEFIQADILARYFRKKKGKENVFFNVGTDEHGLKIYQKAQENNQSAQEYVDFYAGRWQEFCELFSISYDSFYRTSDPKHHKLAQKFWEKSSQNGDIYKKKYEGLYCVGCEEFKTEKDLVDGKCPLHNSVPIKISEENYFFKLSKYREDLLAWLDKNPDVVKPEHKLSELKNWIKNMEDISISRVKEKLPWGIQVPGDSTQVMYVWFDALTNYTNVFFDEDFEDKSKFEKWWPGIQFFGPDNLRFQCAIWQSMLLSSGFENSASLLCHGMVLADDGTKMSKSIGNVISPFDQHEKYGTEAVRFYLGAGFPTYSDSSYKDLDLINLYNSHLADNFGNLLNRVIHLSIKSNSKINNHESVEVDFKNRVDEFSNNYSRLMESFEIQSALQIANELASYGNEYITIQKPWEIKDDSQRVEKILNNLSYLLHTLIGLYEPVIPTSSEKAYEHLNKVEPVVLFEKINGI